ncbi:Ig-like domain (group 2) [Lachnospiraceae bacterium]|nr:Ig-like domain (group 2) [Lachnospiraceae bacterium]
MYSVYNTALDDTVIINIEKPVAKKNNILNPGTTANGLTFFDGITNAKATSWKSSKPSVVSVDSETGMLTAVSSGKAKITAFFGDGKKAAKYKFKIEVPNSFTDKKDTSAASSDYDKKSEAAPLASGTVTDSVSDYDETFTAAVRVEITLTPLTE